MRQVKKPGRLAFTLVELLVVLAIIATLAGLLLPALSRAKGEAWGVACLNHLKQVGIAMVLYSDENGDALPRSQHSGESWVGSLQPYAGGTNLWRCPRDPHRTRRYSYAINDYLLPVAPDLSPRPDFSRRTAVPAPSDTLFMTEGADGFASSDHFHFDSATDPDAGYAPLQFASQVAIERHQQSANYLFVDSHVERRRWSAVKPTLARVGSRFVNPIGHNPPP